MKNTEQVYHQGLATVVDEIASQISVAGCTKVCRIISGTVDNICHSGWLISCSKLTFTIGLRRSIHNISNIIIIITPVMVHRHNSNWL